MNTPWPKDTRPRKPPTRFQLAPSAPNMMARSRTCSVKESLTTKGRSPRASAMTAAHSTGACRFLPDSNVCVVMSPPPEQAAWPIPENQDEEDVDADRLQGRRHEISRHGLDHPDQKTGDDGPGQRTETAHAHRHESQQGEHGADRRKHVEE